MTHINITNIKSKKDKNIPPSDFINISFDKTDKTPLKKIYIILSTPRSGSTYLCNIFHNNNFCLPHEYFQPYDYLPYLADKWDCINPDGTLNLHSYTLNLIRKRTYNNGVLGINLHGSHLQLFEKFWPHFKDFNIQFIFLKRQDIISQAVSYEIASQSLKWSSEFESQLVPVYSFEKISKKVNELNNQNTLIESFLNSFNHNFKLLYYEELIKNTSKELNNILSPTHTFKDSKDIKSTIKRQGDSINIDWKNKFYKDYWNTKVQIKACNNKKQISNFFNIFKKEK